MTISNFKGTETLTEVVMKSSVLSDEAMSMPFRAIFNFGGICGFHLQD
jgi:hypothetical protein